MPPRLFWLGLAVSPVALIVGLVFGTEANGLVGNVAANLVLVGPGLFVTHVLIEHWHRTRQVAEVTQQLEGVAAAMAAVVTAVQTDLDSTVPRPWNGPTVEVNGLDSGYEALVGGTLTGRGGTTTASHPGALPTARGQLVNLAKREYPETTLPDVARTLDMASRVQRLALAVARLPLARPVAVEQPVQRLTEAAEEWDAHRGRPTPGHQLIVLGMRLISGMEQLGLALDQQLATSPR